MPAKYVLSHQPRKGYHWTLVATNGRCLVAESHDHPLQFLQVEGISDCTVCRGRDQLASDRRIGHEALRALVVEANRSVAGRPGWTSVPAGGSLLVGADRIARVAPAPAAS